MQPPPKKSAQPQPPPPVTSTQPPSKPSVATSSSPIAATETVQPEQALPEAAPPIEPGSQYWSDYGEQPAPVPLPPEQLQTLLLHVRDSINQMCLAGTPTPPKVEGLDALLRVNLEMFEAKGRVFHHAVDIPLIGFADMDAVRMGVTTVQAALTTLVIAPLIGRITQYLDRIRARSEYSEIPLREHRTPALRGPHSDLEDPEDDEP